MKITRKYARMENLRKWGAQVTDVSFAGTDRVYLLKGSWGLHRWSVRVEL